MKKNILLLAVLFNSLYINAQIDTWSFVSNMPPHPDSIRQLATGFSINDTGYVGLGMNIGGAVYRDFYRVAYSPAFNLDVWAPVADFPFETYDVLSFGIGNKGYVLTSMNAAHLPANNLYAYDPVADAWTMISTFPGTSRQGASCFVINNKAYIISGWLPASGVATNEIWEYNPAGNQWTQKNNCPAVARYKGIAFSIGNYGYFGTGYNQSSQKQNDFWKYDAANDSWTQLGNIPCGPRAEAVGLSIDGRGYISTGTGASVKNDLWEYYPSLDLWFEKQPFPGFSRTNCTGYSIAGRGYVGLGFGTSWNHIWAFMSGNLAVNNIGGFYYCTGDTLNVEYASYNQTFAAGNIFNVEADASLGFTNPVVIGSLSSTADHGFITAVIPPGLTPSQSYRIRVTSSSPADTSGTNSYYFSVDITPPQPSITTSGDTLISSAITGNQWYDDNGPITGAINQQFLPTAPGNYYVVVSNNGCNSAPSSIVTDIKNNYGEDNLTVFPNPFKGTFIVQSKSNMEFSIINSMGQIIYKSKAAKGEKTMIDLLNSPSGIYYLNSVEEKTFERKSHKLVLIR